MQKAKRENKAPAAKKPVGFAVYVSGFTFEGVGEGDARREAFNTAFGGYGEITNVKVAGKDKPFAFVTFSDEESRDKAVAAGPATVGGAECEVAAQVIYKVLAFVAFVVGFDFLPRFVG